MNKRTLCPNCEYILARCLCETLKPIDNATRIIILQHPSETRHALSTVNLLKKSFLNINIFIGENFSEHLELNTIIKSHQENIGLIFPATTNTVLSSSSKKMSHLIFIDGTWKKARKMYLISKNLHTLPAFALIPSRPSQYKIRSSKFGHTLSTLEATICALEYYEEKLDTKSLENSFLKMIEFQIEKMGEETFRKNYQRNSGSDE